MNMHRLGRSWIARMGFSAALVGSDVAVVAPPTPASAAIQLRFPLTVVAASFRFFGVPDRLPESVVDLHLLNISPDDEHEIVAVNLGPDCGSTVNSVADAQALLTQAYAQAAAAGSHSPVRFIAAACPEASFEGRVFADPNFGQDSRTFTFTPGKTLYFCGVPEPDGSQHFDLGMIGFLDIFSLPNF